MTSDSGRIVESVKAPGPYWARHDCLIHILNKHNISGKPNLLFPHL